MPERGQLNRQIAETLWGKQLDLDENQLTCRNSLPRPASEARSKFQSIDVEIENVEVEIQDILAKPLIAEVTISSPSLFDDTSTTNSSQTSPPITAEFRDLKKIY